MQNLDFDQLSALLHSVFGLRAQERDIVIMTDLPCGRMPDHAAWSDRRQLAGEWFVQLVEARERLPFRSIVFCTYANVGSNNNDLPRVCTVATSIDEYRALPAGREAAFGDVLAAASVVIAPTELSATAPLKLLARTHGFRGATLPGFMRSMIPVLGLDYERVSERVMQFRERMDRAEGVDVVLDADGRAYRSHFDLRFRTGHASGGLMREDGVVGNLPSGEAYIVPYEGERDGEPSRTAGELPVQFDDDVVVYRIRENRALDVLGDSARADAERELLRAEPAYGNMAEVGIGVLGEWGVEAVGSTLLDEKLGLHIAFGRSDHFGGVTGPGSFRDAERVVHIDRVYVRSTQPRISVTEVTFVYPGDVRETIIRQDRYVV